MLLAGALLGVRQRNHVADETTNIVRRDNAILSMIKQAEQSYDQTTEDADDIAATVNTPVKNVLPMDPPSWEFLKKKYGSKYDSLRKHWSAFVMEEYATGVPAELTAAQYFIESQCGESWLAKNGRNLYGFKAGKWSDKEQRWIMFNWVPGQQGIVWRKDDCYCKGKSVPCPFVDFQTPFWSVRAKSRLTLKKFKPDSALIASYPGREWRAWVDKLAPSNLQSRDYRRRNGIPNYATSQQYHQSLLQTIRKFKFYNWPKN